MQSYLYLALFSHLLSFSFSVFGHQRDTSWRWHAYICPFQLNLEYYAVSVYDRELSVSRLSTQLICMTRTLADILIVKSEFSCIDVFFISFNQVTCLSYLILLLLLFLIIFNYNFFFPIGGPLAVRRPQAPACIAYASGRP